MRQRLRRPVAYIFLFALVAIVAGCSLPDGTPGADHLMPTLLPTPMPTVTPPPASLTAKEIVVKRLRNADAQGEPQEDELEKDDEIDIIVNDRIAVQKNGRGLLRFRDDLLVEIFRGSELQLSDAKRDTPDELFFVKLEQFFGHTLTELNNEADARVRLETEYAVIESVDDLGRDTEFAVCHAPKLTCMVTLAGTVEVSAQGQTVTVEAGEASYIFPGQPPSPPICAVLSEVERWIEQFRGEEEVPALGDLVVDWPQQPCLSPTAVDATPTVSPLPSGDSMVNVPEGQYMIGVPEADEFHIPAKPITLKRFWIDQFEVTNAQYQLFVEENGRTPPTNWPGGLLPPGQERHPVSGVTWDDAVAYCSWVNKRLPSEAEWEVAARGPDQEPPFYPWGSDPGASGQAFELPLNGTYEVGSKPFNISPFGVYDMAGNVWEWVADPYGPVPEGQQLLRGGRYGFLKDMAFRQSAEPASDRFVPFAGFRCAASQIEGE